MWKKLGNIYDKHHAQVPVALTLDDKWRIFYSDRINGKSVPKYIDVSKEDYQIINSDETPISDHGRKGTFDWAGVMPTAVIKPEQSVTFLYYIGWAIRKDVPYHNNLGLMISKDNGKTFQKFSEGPVLSTSYKEPGYVGTISILLDNDIFKGWYLSCREWIETADGKIEPVYDIKYATSKNGIDWDPTNETCICLEDDEGGISQASVIKDSGVYHMWFSSRKKSDFRNNKDNSYRIRYATSKDGVHWTRQKDLSFGLDVSLEGWDSEMVEYPCVVKENKDLYLFYNGNGFGRTGIGLAKWTNDTQLIF